MVSRSPTASTGETSRACRVSWLDHSPVTAAAGLPNHAAAVASTAATLRMPRPAVILFLITLPLDVPRLNLSTRNPLAGGDSGLRQQRFDSLLELINREHALVGLAIDHEGGGRFYPVLLLALEAGLDDGVLKRLVGPAGIVGRA